MSIRVLGVDPGLANMGVAAVELTSDGESICEVSVFSTVKSTKKQNVNASSDTIRRARTLSLELANFFERHRPCVVAVEAMSFPRNASSAAKTAVSWGLLVSEVRRYNIPIVQASPQEMKRALCGKVSASKLEVQEVLKARHPDAFHDFVREYPKRQHEHGFDAVGAVVACLDSEVMRMARGWWVKDERDK
jgi:crossover junction endodeoxyribonuclease RuvC